MHKSRSFLRTTLATTALALTLTSAAPSARTEPTGETVRWLMTEPVTLMDLGLIRLREDLRAAAEELVHLGFTPRTPRVGTYFEWQTQRVVAYVSYSEPYAAPSEGTCREVFSRVVRHLSAKAPGGQGEPGWYLETLFAHEGPGNLGRPKKMREELLDTVHFEVKILPPDPMRDSRKIGCSGRMDTAIEALVVTTS